MSKTLNQVNLIGYLGKDPEIKYTASGVLVASCSIATDSFKRGKDEELIRKTDWHNIKLIGKKFEILVNYLKKGQHVYTSGKLEYFKFKDDEGNYKNSIHIGVKEIIILNSKEKNGLDLAKFPINEKTREVGNDYNTIKPSNKDGYTNNNINTNISKKSPDMFHDSSDTDDIPF
jgi:single-strand DNA-binding protein